MSSSSYIQEGRKALLSGIAVPEKREIVVDDFQREAIASVMSGFDTLVVAPTGSGKTYIAIDTIRSMLEMGTRAIYTTPLKALSNTKFNEFKTIFEPARKVGLLTGDRKIDVDGDVVVATTEIYRNELYRGAARYSLIILDEVHFIADPQRGAVWEESIILTPSDATLLMLSASISNAREIADWMADVRGKECKIVLKTERPVELRYGFIHPEYGVVALRNSDGSLSKEVGRFYGALRLNPAGVRLEGAGTWPGGSRGGGRERRGRRGRRR